MELIDRDALLKLAQRKCGKLCSMCDSALDDDSWCDAELFGVDIRRQPTVDAKPVVHGEWSSIPIGLWQCTRCAKIFDYAYNFCPNCGADMRGDTDE